MGFIKALDTSTSKWYSVTQFNDGELLEFREALASTPTHKRVTCQRLSQRNNGYQIIGQRFFADELKILDYYRGNEGRCK